MTVSVNKLTYVDRVDGQLVCDSESEEGCFG